MYRNYQLHRAWPGGGVLDWGQGGQGPHSVLLCAFVLSLGSKKKILILQVAQCCWRNSENVSNFGKNLGKS